MQLAQGERHPVKWGMFIVIVMLALSVGVAVSSGLSLLRQLQQEDLERQTMQYTGANVAYGGWTFSCRNGEAKFFFIRTYSVQKELGGCPGNKSALVDTLRALREEAKFIEDVSNREWIIEKLDEWILFLT